MQRLNVSRSRIAVGCSAAGTATFFIAWLVLALFSDIPTPQFSFLEQSGVRLLAEVSVVCLLIAAVAFWDE